MDQTSSCPPSHPSFLPSKLFVYFFFFLTQSGLSTPQKKKSPSVWRVSLIPRNDPKGLLLKKPFLYSFFFVGPTLLDLDLFFFLFFPPFHRPYSYPSYFVHSSALLALAPVAFSSYGAISLCIASFFLSLFSLLVAYHSHTHTHLYHNIKLHLHSRPLSLLIAFIHHQ